MASSSIDIKIRALVEGLQNISQLSLGLQNAAGAAQSSGSGAASGAAGWGSLHQTIQQTREGAATLQSSLAALPGKLGLVGAAFSTLKENMMPLIGLFSTLALAYGLKESADYTARTETLGITMGIVAKNAGYSTTEIAKYVAETKKMGITTQATSEALTKMIQAGLPIGQMAGQAASNVARLARAAQDLAVVTGENSSVTLTRLITNIQQADAMGLRFMGLTVNMESAQSKFGAAIGKTADQLTGAQKTMAVYNAVMLEAQKLEGSYEASLESVGKKLQSLKRYQEELANAVGKLLLPAYAALADSAKTFLEGAEKTITGVDKTGASARAMGEGAKAFFDGIGSIFTVIINLAAEIYKTLAPTMGQILSLVGELASAVALIVTFGGGMAVAGEQVTVFGTAINIVVAAVGYLVAAFRDGMAIILSVVQAGVGLAIGAFGLAATAAGKLIGLFNKKWGDEFVEAGKAMIGTANSLGDAAAGTVTKFAKGESAVMKYGDALFVTEQRTKALAAATDFKGIEEQIRVLTSAKREATQTDVQLKEGSDKVAQSMKRLGDEGKLSEKEIGNLNAQLGKVRADSAERLVTAFTDMNVKLVKIGEKEYLEPLNKELGKVSAGIIEVAQNADKSSAVFQQAFAKGLDSAKTVGDLSTLAGSFDAAKNAGKDLGDSVQLAGAKLFEVFNKQISTAKTREEFELLKQQVLTIGPTLGLTEDQITGMAVSIDAAFIQSKQSIENAGITPQLKVLGTTAEEVRGEVTQMGHDVVDAFISISDSGKLTGSELEKAFATGINKVKTLQDLGEMNQALKEQGQLGRIIGADLKAATDESAVAFEKLFASQLKAANTKVDFDSLTASVTAMGSSGSISADVLATSLGRIKLQSDEAATSMARLAKQAVELGNASVNVARAGLAVTKAHNEVIRAELTVRLAANRVAREGTREARLALDVAQAELEVKRQQAMQAELAFNIEVRAYDVLIAKQRLLNAEKILDPALREQAVLAAQTEFDLISKSLDVLKERLATQQKITLSAEETLENTKMELETAIRLKQIKDSTPGAGGPGGGGRPGGGAGGGGGGSNPDDQTDPITGTKKHYVGSQGSYTFNDVDKLRIKNQKALQSGDFSKFTEQDLATAETAFEADSANLAMKDNNRTAFSFSGIDSVDKYYRTSKVLVERLRAQFQQQQGEGADQLSQQMLGQLPSRGGNFDKDSMQSIAKENAPSKVIQVNFKDSAGNAATATMPAAQEESFLKMLGQAKGVSN